MSEKEKDRRYERGKEETALLELETNFVSLRAHKTSKKNSFSHLGSKSGC